MRIRSHDVMLSCTVSKFPREDGTVTFPQTRPSGPTSQVDLTGLTRISSIYVCGCYFRTGNEPFIERRAASNNITDTPPTPTNFTAENDFVERATQGITNLSGEVSPTSHATQQPLTPYNVVLGQLYVSRVSFSEASPVPSPWLPTPVSTHELKTTCTDPLQSMSALVSQPLLAPVSTTPMTISRPSLSLQHPIPSLSMEGVSYIPTLASGESRSSIDPLITADSQIPFFETSRITFPTPMTYSGAHASVSLPYSTSVLTTVAQTTSSPSVTQRLYGDSSSLHVAFPTSTVALANQGDIHGNTHDHFRVLSEHGSRGIVVSEVGSLTPNQSAAVEMNRLTGHTAPASNDSMAPLATRIPLQSITSSASGHLTTHMRISGSAPVVQYTCSGTSLPSLQSTASLAAPGHWTTHLSTSGSAPVVQYPYSGTSLQSLQPTAVSLSSSSPTLPHQPTVVSTQSVTQSSSESTSITVDVDAHRAGEAFRQHRGDLLIAVTDPLILANSLYSRRIISRETLSEVRLPTLTDGTKNVILFDAVEDRIRTHPSDFLILLAILGRDSQLCIFAEGIRNSYCKCSTIIHACMLDFQMHAWSSHFIEQMRYSYSLSTYLA